MAFPLVGAFLIFMLVLPAAAVASKFSFWGLKLLEARSGIHGHDSIRYALLVLPTALPVGYFVSAALHQAESGSHRPVCAVAHTAGSFCCAESALLILALLLILAAFLLRRPLWRKPTRAAGVSVCTAQQQVRVIALLEGCPDLVPYLRQFSVVEHAPEPIATRGMWRLEVVIDARFAELLDDEALLGALRHEAEHVRHFDPLRYFLVRTALALNPIGNRLLGPELSRWILTREAHCDREAVLRGASAPALAQALVCAARFEPAERSLAVCSLHCSGMDMLRLRVDLLLGYADRRPHKSCCRTPTGRLALCALLIGLILPHRAGEQILDSLHLVSENALSLILN